MGLFDKPIVTCNLCNHEIGKKEKRWQTKDGYMCAECADPFLIHGPRAFVNDTTEELKEMRKNSVIARKFWANNKKEFEKLEPTRNIGNILFVDDKKKKWYLKPPEEKFVFHLDPNTKFPQVFNFTDIIEVSVALGEKTIKSTAVTRKDKGIRKAVAGGIIAGAPGAIIGGMMAKEKTTTRIIEAQSYYVNILTNGAKEPISLIANNENAANELNDGFLSILPDDVIQKANKPDSKTSSANELREFKNLLDDGIITQEDFDAKKKQLLGL